MCTKKITENLAQTDKCIISAKQYLDAYDHYVQTQKTPILKANIKQDTAYIFLHGLNDKPATWNKVVGSTCGTMEGATIQNGVKLFGPYNEWAIKQRCFKVDFTSPSRAGLENITNWNHGDGATYQELGQQVFQAVNLVVNQYPNIGNIILVGHSRGGLSAKAALAYYNNGAMSHVKGVLTFGSPHQGSIMGRIYKWLATNKRPDPSEKRCLRLTSMGGYTVHIPVFCNIQTPEERSKNIASGFDRNQAWAQVDLLKLPHIVTSDIGLDIRAPSISYLSVDSSFISNLNISSNSILSKQCNPICTIIIPFNQVKIGDLMGAPSLSDFLSTLPVTLQKYLQGNQPPLKYQGDGIVHYSSQFLTSGNPYIMPTINNIRHMEEIGQIQPILAAIRKLESIMPAYKPQ